MTSYETPDTSIDVYASRTRGVTTLRLVEARLGLVVLTWLYRSGHGISWVGRDPWRSLSPVPETTQGNLKVKPDTGEHCPDASWPLTGLGLRPLHSGRNWKILKFNLFLLVNTKLNYLCVFLSKQITSVPEYRTSYRQQSAVSELWEGALQSHRFKWQTVIASDQKASPATDLWARVSGSVSSLASLGNTAFSEIHFWLLSLKF